MKVIRKSDGQQFNVEKSEDGTYEVEGIKLSPAMMKEMFDIVKPVAKKPTVVSSKHTLLSETDMSESIGHLALALSKAQAEFSGVKKDSSGYSYNYADLNSVIQASAPIFTKHELAITQDTLGLVVDDIYYTGVKTMLIHSSGEWKSATAYMPTERTKQNPLVQMYGVNSTYLRRYQYQAIIGLATTDSDGNA